MVSWLKKQMFATAPFAICMIILPSYSGNIKAPRQQQVQQLASFDSKLFTSASSDMCPSKILFLALLTPWPIYCLIVGIYLTPNCSLCSSLNSHRNFLGKMSTAGANDSCSDLSIDQATMQCCVTAAYPCQKDAHWLLWREYCVSKCIGPFFTRIQESIPNLLVFAQRYQEGLPSCPQWQGCQISHSISQMPFDLWVTNFPGWGPIRIRDLIPLALERPAMQNFACDFLSRNYSCTNLLNIKWFSRTMRLVFNFI